MPAFQPNNIRLQTLSIWKSLKLVIWESVKSWELVETGTNKKAEFLLTEYTPAFPSQETGSR